jgi:hypothetical protein
MPVIPVPYSSLLAVHVTNKWRREWVFLAALYLARVLGTRIDSALPDWLRCWHIWIGSSAAQPFVLPCGLHLSADALRMGHARTKRTGTSNPLHACTQLTCAGI